MQWKSFFYGSPEGGETTQKKAQNKKFWQYVRHHSSFLIVLLSTPKLQRETSTNKVKFIALDMKSFWLSTSKLHINILLALASQMKWRNFSNIWFSFSSWFWIHYSPGINANNDYTYCCSLKQERIILQGFILETQYWKVITAKWLVALQYWNMR